MNRLLIFLAVSWMGIGLNPTCANAQTGTIYFENFSVVIVVVACLINILLGFFIYEDNDFFYGKLIIGIFITLIIVMLLGWIFGNLLIFLSPNLIGIPIIMYIAFIVGYFLSKRRLKKEDYDPEY